MKRATTQGSSSPGIPRIALASPTNGPSTPYMWSKATIRGVGGGGPWCRVVVGAADTRFTTAASARADNGQRKAFFMADLHKDGCSPRSYAHGADRTNSGHGSDKRVGRPPEGEAPATGTGEPGPD